MVSTGNVVKGFRCQDLEGFRFQLIESKSDIRNLLLTPETLRMRTGYEFWKKCLRPLEARLLAQQKGS